MYLNKEYLFYYEEYYLLLRVSILLFFYKEMQTKSKIKYTEIKVEIQSVDNIQ